jgi:hypothetical protein
MNYMSAIRVFLFWTSAPKWFVEKLFSILKKIKASKKKKSDQNVYLFSVVPNDRLVVELFNETMV